MDHAASIEYPPVSGEPTSGRSESPADALLAACGALAMAEKLRAELKPGPGEAFLVDELAMAHKASMAAWARMIGSLDAAAEKKLSLIGANINASEVSRIGSAATRAGTFYRVGLEAMRRRRSDEANREARATGAAQSVRERARGADARRTDRSVEPVQCARHLPIHPPQRQTVDDAWARPDAPTTAMPLVVSEAMPSATTPREGTVPCDRRDPVPLEPALPPERVLDDPAAGLAACDVPQHEATEGTDPRSRSDTGSQDEMLMIGSSPFVWLTATSSPAALLETTQGRRRGRFARR